MFDLIGACLSKKRKNAQRPRPQALISAGNKGPMPKHDSMGSKLKNSYEFVMLARRLGSCSCHSLQHATGHSRKSTSKKYLKKLKNKNKNKNCKPISGRFASLIIELHRKRAETKSLQIKNKSIAYKTKDIKQSIAVVATCCSISLEFNLDVAFATLCSNCCCCCCRFVVDLLLFFYCFTWPTYSAQETHLITNAH